MTDDDRNDNGPPTESAGEKRTSIGHDQDSSVSLESDTDDNTSQGEDEEEDWTDFIIRSTRETGERMWTFTISCWIETQRKTKRRLAMRIPSYSKERWTKKQHDGTHAFAQERERTKRGKTEEEMGG